MRPDRSKAAAAIASVADSLRPSATSPSDGGGREGESEDLAMAKKPKAVVLGVGALRGIGGAASRRFAKEGYHVLVAGRTPKKIEAVVPCTCSRSSVMRGCEPSGSVM